MGVPHRTTPVNSVSELGSCRDRGAHNSAHYCPRSQGAAEGRTCSAKAGSARGNRGPPGPADPVGGVNQRLRLLTSLREASGHWETFQSTSRGALCSRPAKKKKKKKKKHPAFKPPPKKKKKKKKK